MIQKNPGMILHGRDIIQYKKDGHIGRLFLYVNDQGNDPQMNGIEQIIEGFRQLSALLSVIEIDQRKCQDPEDLYFISIQKTRQQIMAVTVDPRDRAMGDHDMRHIPY